MSKSQKGDGDKAASNATRMEKRVEMKDDGRFIIYYTFSKEQSSSESEKQKAVRQ